ncbi:pirin family protein [Saccharophagus sp. K07]|jgi:redox-sensitive bicupin YhaK (pirin superfamily)|uniref:pirin family protein n=1 Tax=Saccharophagus sp. K07 TaxID=2283636 RepID=UPI0016526B1D|nr:pirin family protein [Saccharophagus sp. K07]MBC6904601.1 pirin family protein [Saccharophagus sp. K07]
MSSESPKDFASSLECPAAVKPVLERVTPHVTDVGGIAVNRVLPRRARRLVGSWCFLDHIGPLRNAAIDLHVGEHPHIGLQTFTWMMEGEILHRDSLGSDQVIRPGQVNLMTAGRGIAHTEDALPGQNAIHAAQLWIALPKEQADTEPRFDHYADLPKWQAQNAELTLLIGEYANKTAPTLRFSPIVGVDLQILAAGETILELREDFEYGLLPLSGSLNIEGETFAENDLAYLGCGRRSLTISTTGPSRALLVGGAPVTDEVLIWWNFVGHDRATIIQAQEDWLAKSGRFAPVPGATKRLAPPPIPWRS